MRILRVAQNFDDHVFPLSRIQAQMGHDVTVLRPCEADESPGEVSKDGYTVVRKPVVLDIFGNRFSAGVARYLKNTHSYDIIHAHSHLFISTNLAALKRVVSDKPLAITNHGIHSQSVPSWFSKAYLHTLGRWTYNRADVIFCYTATEAKQLRKFGIRTDCQVIPNGIDHRKFTPDGPTSDLIDPDVPSILFAGRLAGGKRPQDAIKAVARLHQQGINVRLYVCGDGPMQKELEDIARRTGVGDSVEFLGYVSGEKMPQIYRSSDILILTSRTEGVPRVVLEALACATPVVTSALPQLKEFVPEAGFTVPVGDIDTFANQIAQLLKNKQQQTRLGQQGRTIVEQTFIWDALVKNTTSVLKQIADQYDYSR